MEWLEFILVTPLITLTLADPVCDIDEIFHFRRDNLGGREAIPTSHASLPPRPFNGPLSRTAQKSTMHSLTYRTASRWSCIENEPWSHRSAVRL